MLVDPKKNDATVIAELETLPEGQLLQIKGGNGENTENIDNIIEDIINH